MSSSPPELPGVAALADRPVDGRRVARTMAIAGVALALAGSFGIEHLLGTMDREPEAARLLREHSSAPAVPRGPARHVAVVLVDGMRVDEAEVLPAWQALATEGVTATLELPTPTLSRPFYHLLLTGVPPDASGVRSNRFADSARLDSVAAQVHRADGSVAFVSEGLSWLRRMYGRRSDGGSDAAASIEPGALDRHLSEWRAAPAPALLIVHVTSTDGTAHALGVRSAEHRRALARADRVIARVAEEAPVLFVLSDHGHRDAGGHGGPEPEVARAPLLVRAPGLEPATAGSMAATRLAPTIAAWLGVPGPRSAVSPPAGSLLTDGAIDRREPARLASLAQQGRRVDELRLARRVRWLLPLALVLAVLTLGPIKRAFGFDRATPLALLAWPALVVAGHLALGRPLSLSAIDTQLGHGVRVAGLGVVSALIGFGVARLLSARGDAITSTRRVAACVGWSAFVSALVVSCWCGLALGPWALTPLEVYLPLFALGAAAPALVVMSLVLFVSRCGRD